MKNIVFIFMLAYLDCQGQADRHLKYYFESLFDSSDTDLIEKIQLNLSETERQHSFNNFVKFDRLNPNPRSGFFGDTSGVYYVNLNNDEFTDIIYVNSLGLYCTSIYYGTKDSVVLMIDPSPPNHLKDLKFKDGICTEAIFEYTPYVDAVHGEMIYRLKRDKFLFIYKRYNRDCTKQPNTYFENNLQIKTKKNAHLRENPSTDRGHCFYESGDSLYNNTNNVFYVYDTEVKGIAWAKEEDSIGRTYYLVELQRKNDYDHNKQKELKPKYRNNEFNIGWMLSDDLEIIGETKDGN